MTISLQANAAGTAGQINIGATPVVSIPVASGLPFCKNKLFNGEVTRINQRAFDGNWATKNFWWAGTQAERESCYGWDMWARSNNARADGGPGLDNMCQWIEAGNFRPSTVHTLSGTGVITTQITSPASGNWRIDVAQTARNIQVEEGSVATPFETRPFGFELAQCMRYFCVAIGRVGGFTGAGTGNENIIGLPATMRVQPFLTNYNQENINTTGAVNTSFSVNQFVHYSVGVAQGGYLSASTSNFSAVI